MVLARKELGEDAMLIHSRPAQPEVRHLGVYEVVFGVYPSAGNQAAEEGQESVVPSDPPEPRRSDQTQTSIGEPASQQESLAQQVAVLRQEMERMIQTLSGQTQLPLPQAAAPEVMETQHEAGADARYQLLLEQELDPALARDAALGKPLEDAFEVNPTLGRAGSEKVIVALVGPPGCGKTTTLAKLAARYGLLARKRVHLLSIDVLRIGASDQLRTLASLLGIGFGFAETPAELDRMIEEQYKKDLILIDTPGLGKDDMEDARELAQMIGSDPDIDTHLVLPASMRAEDLVRQVNQFRVFHPGKMIFTRMDETSRYGALISLAAETGLPVSFLAHGQRIPDDLEPAAKQNLLELVGVASISLNPQPKLGMGAAA